jgi:hypothetical protein
MSLNYFLFYLPIADCRHRLERVYFVEKLGDLEILPELGFGEDAAGFDDFSCLVTSSAFS